MAGVVGNSDTIDEGPFGKNPFEQQMTGRCIFNNSLKSDMFGRWLGTDAPAKYTAHHSASIAN